MAFSLLLVVCLERMKPTIPETSGETLPSSTEGVVQETAEKAFDVEAYLTRIATGAIPYDPMKGEASLKVSTYGKALLGHLSRLLNMDQKEVMTLALCHYARCLTSAPISSLNDLGVQTQGLQLSVQDLVLEVMEFNELAVSVSNQEAIAGPAERA